MIIVPDLKTDQMVDSVINSGREPLHDRVARLGSVNVLDASL